MTKRTMPICCDLEQYKLIEKYAKNRGMVNASQAVEKSQRKSKHKIPSNQLVMIKFTAKNIIFLKNQISNGYFYS